MELLFCDFCGRFQTHNTIRPIQLRRMAKDGDIVTLSAHVCDVCTTLLVERFKTQSRADLSTIPSSLK